MSSELISNTIAIASTILSGCLTIIIAIINNKAKASRQQHDTEILRLRADVNHDNRLFGLLEKQIATTQAQGLSIEKLAEATRGQSQSQAMNQTQIIEAFEKLGGVIKMNEARYQSLDEHVSKMDALSLDVIEKVVPLTSKVQKLVDTFGSELANIKQKCTDDVKGELSAIEQRIRGDIQNLLNEVNSIKSQEDTEHETNLPVIPVVDADGVGDVDRSDSSDGTGDKSES